MREKLIAMIREDKLQNNHKDFDAFVHLYVELNYAAAMFAIKLPHVSAVANRIYMDEISRRGNN